ncbi:MAG TPA: hypothetical protein EYP56_15060 [Planctomycetaceae bacterium]|nr:hypothetical protein [Planctomycetaceae bacterium]
MRENRFLFGLIVIVGLSHGVRAGENPCTNGSFEALGPNGFPVDWSPVGQTVTTSRDAHTGQLSLRLLRAAGTPTRETGLNRGWRPGGRGGALITQLRGGMDFWYKALSAQDAELNIYVIPMNEEPREATGSPRAVFTVPPEHIGDGGWHRGRLKYDYTDNPKVKWVHFAARIVGTAGEMLLDDIAYVEKVGPLLQLGKITMDEDPQRPGHRATVRVVVQNIGDQPTGRVNVQLLTPEGLRALPAERRLARLAPEGRRVLRWTIEGVRSAPCAVEVAASAESTSGRGRLVLDRGLRIRSFGPAEPVAFSGRPAVVECELENTGQVILGNVVAEFRLSDGTLRQSVTAVAPGQKAVLRAEFIPEKVTDRLPLAVRAAAEGIQPLPVQRSAMAVIAPVKVPAPSGRLRAAADSQMALLENEFLRLVFFRDSVGFGPAQLQLRTDAGWQSAAWLPRLGRVVVAADTEGQERPGRKELPVRCTKEPRATVEGDSARLVFPCVVDLGDAGLLHVTVRYRLSAGSKLVAMHLKADCRRGCDLLALEGPFVYVLERRQAVFPGLEWLVDDELSSDSLDILESHPDRLRYVVHPNKITIPAVGISGGHGTVAMIWDVHQRWDGRRDRPAFVFASPDRFENQRSHTMGLFLPSVPEFVPENGRLAETPYRLKPGESLQLSAWIFADGAGRDPLAPIEQYLQLVGLPDPAPLPHGTFEGEIAFSMRAYLESLWEAEGRQWWTSKGGGMLSKQGRPPAFVADLLLGEIVARDPQLRRACRQRARQVAALLGRPARVDAMRFPGRADLAMANPRRAAALLRSRRQDGSWRFDADQPGTGPFVGKDYRDLGPHDALEVGTCARNAYVVLSYARIAGDLRIYQAMRSTLELMERFRVPRAAQVWEIPVHTPDVLAAADAVDAYLEAYRLSGDRRWLADAVTWARRGLPFVYLWDDEEKPFLLGASIPVFGATWYRGSWFGRAVQWNGLRYANALLKLAEYDQSLPWRTIAELVIRSAIHQQDLDGENVALWPDNISAVDSTKCPWMFAPRQIIGCVLKLIERDEEPATVILGTWPKRLHLTSTGRISRAQWEENKLHFDVRFPPHEEGVVLVSNISEPQTVMVDGRAVPRRDDVETVDRSAWRYDPAYAYLAIRIATAGPVRLEVAPAAFVAVRRMSSPDGGAAGKVLQQVPE